MIGNGNRVVHTDATLTGAGSSASPLAVAAPGLAAVTTDTTLTGDGTSGTPLSVATPYSDPTVGGTKIRRIDTGAWETARKCAGVVTAAADSSTSPGAKTTITSAAHEQTEGTTVTIAGTTDYNGAHAISNVTTDTFDIEVVYTSSQTGAWTADNEYLSPDQRDGFFGTVYRRYYRGNPSGTDTVLHAGFHAAYRFIGARGVGINSATGFTLPVSTYYSSISRASVDDDGTDLRYSAGTDFDDAGDVYSLSVDYYKL